MAGIYIHIPFCKKACYYCNFHFSTSLKYKDQMVLALHKELEQRNNYLAERQIESVYFGGGTPSLLSEYDIRSFMEAIGSSYDLSDEVEVTLEANPDDLDIKSLKALKAAGVNRLSIGIQSFFDEDLQWMNRSHTGDQAHQSISKARDIGFENISIDLIYGLPGNSMQKWQDNLHEFLEYDLAHLSCYALTIEKGTVFGNWLKKGKMEETPDKEMETQFFLMHETLVKAGYEHYEISNLGKKGFEAVHNSNYWKGIPYLGVGPSAHSFDGSSRQWNISNNATYLNALNGEGAYFEREALDANTRFNELVMLGLRTHWGINREKVKDLGDLYLDFLDSHAEALIKDGIISFEDDHYFLKTGSLFLADGIAASLFRVD